MSEPSQTYRPSRPAILAFVATTWFSLLPLIVAWNAALEGREPGVGLGSLTILVILASPVVGWAFAKNISELGVEHAQRPAFCALLLVGCIWGGGLHLHLTGGLWLGKCTALTDADACLAAGNYFDSGDATFQGTIDAKELWKRACIEGSEVGWKGCRKIVHSAGYRRVACEALSEHCNAEDRNVGACWDWGVVCNRSNFVDDEVDRKAAEHEKADAEGRSSATDPAPKTLFETCVTTDARGVSRACDLVLDRGILHQRGPACDQVERTCAESRSWPCVFTLKRCAFLLENPYRNAVSAVR